jgi:hypothetical protein
MNPTYYQYYNGYRWHMPRQTPPSKYAAEIEKTLRRRAMKAMLIDFTLTALFVAALIVFLVLLPFVAPSHSFIHAVQLMIFH